MAVYNTMSEEAEKVRLFHPFQEAKAGKHGLVPRCSYYNPVIPIVEKKFVQRKVLISPKNPAAAPSLPSYPQKPAIRSIQLLQPSPLASHSSSSG